MQINNKTVRIKNNNEIRIDQREKLDESILHGYVIFNRPAETD